MNGPSQPDGGFPRSVSVLRVPKVVPICVRFLGTYTGTILHYNREGSIPCDGDGACPTALHKLKSIWRGYAPVEQLDRASQKWWPEVLEITEYAEEQLHGRALRGEVFVLGRYTNAKKKGKVWCQYLENADPAQLRPAFDILPVVLRLYHVLSMRLGVPNPVPRRVFMEPVEGPTPDALIDGADGASTKPAPMDADTFREMLKRAGFGVSKATTNGHGPRQEGGSNG